MTRRQDYPALDNEHGAFCSCQACIDWRHATRLEEWRVPRSEETFGSYSRPLSPRKKLLWWGLAMLACAAIWLGFILLALRAM